MAAVSPRAEAEPGPAGLSRRFARAWTLLADEALLVVVSLTVASIWCLDLSGGLRADSWLTLLGGREILAHGLPDHDALAVVSRGREWIDQQWLSQILLYELFRLGGIGAVVRANTILFLAPLFVSLVAARRRGASAPRVLVVAIPAFLLTATFVRAQAFSQLLFVLLLLLLLAESRRPSWRVALVVPLLALWANLHGAVVVGAALAAGLGVVELVRAGSRRERARAAALVTVPWLCVLATPYAFGLTAYYRATLANPLLAKYVTEWRSPKFLSPWGVLFFLLAFLAVFLVARRPRRLNAFELFALVLTLGGGLLAVRSIVWFIYASTILLPPLLEDVWPARGPARSRAGDRAVRAGAAAASVVMFLVLLGRPVGPLGDEWPPAASAAVARLVQQDHTARVLANEEYADWLLFEVPSLRGRIAFDGRWEILSRPQFEAAMRFLHQQGANWERMGTGYSVLVLDPRKNRQLVATFASRRDWRIRHRDDKVVVLERTENR